jgi:hypothetical protein
MKKWKGLLFEINLVRKVSSFNDTFSSKCIRFDKGMGFIRCKYNRTQFEFRINASDQLEIHLSLTNLTYLTLYSYIKTKLKI